MADDEAPYHGHIYYSAEQRPAADALRDQFIQQASVGSESRILFVGRMMDTGVGPHPMPQYEIHFLKRSLENILLEIEASGLRALVHPLTDDDLADHTTLGHWLGEPLDLDLTVLDPPGRNQGVPRFGKSDF
ncbi:MAG: DOPA 4,5-dioxygenase family protein [Sphingomicrobium sp.]|jgi:aromatic ring-cleaving dioxygenase